MRLKSLDELREKSNEELVKILNELNDELFKITRMKEAGGAVEKPGRVKHLRKTRARILTILRERGVRL